MIRTVAALLLCVCASSSACADFVLYTIPGTGAAIVLQGTTTVHPGRTVSLRHPRFGNLHFGLEDVRIHEVPTTQEICRRMLNRARGTRDADQVMEAARWALAHGQLDDFYKGCQEALKLDASHAEATRALRLAERLERPLEESSEEEQHLRQTVRNPDMKIQRSAHFILLHDTPAKPSPNHKLPRADERLELLEMVYEAFLQKFYSRGVELEIPTRPLMVVLFAEHDDYLRFAESIGPELRSTAGFWDSKTNVSFFFDQGSTDTYEALKEISRQLSHEADELVRLRVSGGKHIIRLARTLELLVEVGQENSDIEVVSHECTHQLAGNTGLLPRDVMIPSWVHEGLATYFEAPDEATWAGIGAVNEERIRWYRALERDKRHSNIDFIVGDQIFDYAQTIGAALHGYGQAWALTHFLMDRHFEELMTYYRRLGEMPPDVILSSEVLTDLFDEAFGDDREALDAEWRSYMGSLKTDLDRILNESRRR